MKMTIKDIAKLAGVSTTTVSKVMNGKDESISDATKDRIKKIMKENNYTPSVVARSLVTKRTNTIGLIIPDIRNPFFPELARGAEDMASKAGYTIIFCNADNNLSKEDEYLKVLSEKMVDGIIIAVSSKREDQFEKITETSMPIILVDRDIDIDMKCIKGRVITDNFKGACIGVEHMISNGMEKILFISGPLTNKASFERLEGYKSALENHNIDFDQDLLLEGEFNENWGYEAAAIAIEKNLDFDGVFCGNDLIAIGAIKSFKGKGIRIPQDISIVGFDDIYVSSMIEPELTTIRQPKYEMGYRAVEMLIDILEGKKAEQKRLVLQPDIVIRESVKKK